ncbi:hypothetical protein KL867_16950 [Ruegeria litorea]|uniref:Uncharacterized protein n=1 Tax=Falsiruegeria litorea TaxID=1280831 RepID=A0ABS5WUE0_9RHOB|nr:hypothetical protein [Falsiruegeria litorea]MBT3142761.1 hypothetical protein [Falsiruegeria litorea]
MENAFKELFGAVGSRVKSHLFGAVVIFAIVFNWKTAFFLLFSHVSVRSKFVYFDMNADFWSLYVLPIFYAIIFVLGAPFVDNLFHKVISGPVHAMKLRDLEFAEAREATKHELRQSSEQRRADDLRRLEEEALDRARFDSRVMDEDLPPEIAEDLQKQIDELRTRPAVITRDGSVGESGAKAGGEISPLAKEILMQVTAEGALPEIRIKEFIGGAEIEYGNKTLRKDKATDRKWQDYQYAINDLEKHKLIVRPKGQESVWDVLEKGYEVAKLLS